MAALRDARPDDAVLSEEGGDDAGTTRTGPAPRRVWVVDPLDGTREYSEGRDDFAVHVALVVDGLPMVGAVALPGEDLVLVTGARRSGPGRWRRAPTGPLRIVVSRTRPPVEAKRVAARLDAELVPMGSAGAKTAAVLRGTVDAYVHSGGQYEWDSAAPGGRGPRLRRLRGAPRRLRPASTTSPTPGSPICWCADPSCRTPSSTPLAPRSSASDEGQGAHLGGHRRRRRVVDRARQQRARSSTVLGGVTVRCT